MNKKCQVFTPSDYVEKLLDNVGYKHDLYGKKIMENSCGDGNILSSIVGRYIDDGLRVGLSKEKICSGLSRDIYGVEIDPQKHKDCLNRLNVVLEKNGISPVKWNIFNGDYLTIKNNEKYDFVVGNPPYITYSELTKKNQTYLKRSFESCKKGKFDYCYAFLEKSIGDLSDTGEMAYLIPSSIFKTVFGENLRKIMLPHLVTIYDYTQEKVFSDALVKSAIVVLSNVNTGSGIHYVDETTKVDKMLLRDKLGAKWNFADDCSGKRRFGDYFKVSHAIATLCNKAYVIKEWETDTNGNYICDGATIERDVIRDAASPKSLRTEKTEKILFPYSYDDTHVLIRFDEPEFKTKYPGAYNYLMRFKKFLDKRDSDRSAQWYEYGRSQALNHIDNEKALISTIISSQVFVYKLDQKTIPYAGMYITMISDELTIDDGIEILQKQSFLKYAQNVGIPINGNSVRITSKDIEDYQF